MNDIAAIKARRAAVTPEQLRELRFMANCHNKAPLWGEFNRKAIADVLVERDTLLTEVERLTERVQFLSGQYQVGWDEAMRTVTAYANPERDYVELAAAKEEVTAQATDLAYLRRYVHALERYVPEAARRVAVGEARAQLEQQGEGV